MSFKLFISDELRDFLRVIETQSVVAQLLLGKINMDKYGYEYANHPVNYISISHDDRTKISYLSGDRIEELQRSGEDVWTTRFRFKAKPGSFIKKLFKNINPKEVERFSNLYCGENKKPPFTFKVVDGEDIRKYYHYPSYVQSSYGSLGASCMRYDNCQAFLEIYTKNPDKIKMLVMLDEENRLMGRSLLWEFDGFKLMDRIYTVNDEVLPFQFKKWATENGYLYKSEQNWYNSLFFENMEREKQELRFKVNLIKYKHEKYPYLDTFKFWDGKGNLYNYIPENVSLKTLTTCDGGKYDGNVLRFDHVDRVLRHRNECVSLDYLGNDIYTVSNNTCYSGVNNRYILRKDSVYNGEIDDNIFIGEYEHLNNKIEIEQRKEYIKRERERNRLRQEMLQKQKREDRENPGMFWSDMMEAPRYRIRPERGRPLRREDVEVAETARQIAETARQIAETVHQLDIDDGWNVPNMDVINDTDNNPIADNHNGRYVINWFNGDIRQAVDPEPREAQHTDVNDDDYWR